VTDLDIVQEETLNDDSVTLERSKKLKKRSKEKKEPVRISVKDIDEDKDGVLSPESDNEEDSEQEEVAVKKGAIGAAKFNARVNNQSELSDRFT
jgi:hypothetical protein